jgi:hypothetical protein
LAKKNPQRIVGEVFLDGPSWRRVPVDAGKDFAVEFCRLVDAGQRAWDQKDQGLAALTVEYESAASETWGISATGLVGKNGWRVYQVDLDALVNLLRRIVEAENAKNG